LHLGATGNYVPYQELGQVTGTVKGGDDTHYGSYAINAAYWDYTYNNYGFSSPASSSGNGSSQAILINQLNHPSTTVWVVDGEGDYQFDWEYGNPAVVNASGQQTWGSGGLTDGSMCGSRHTGFANILWCDGHAKSMNLSTLMTTKTVTSKQNVTMTVSPYLVVQDYGM